MLEIPTNVVIERMKSFESAQEVPDEWKAIPALTEEQAKVYRTKKSLLKFEGIYKYLALHVPSVVPVYSGDRCIGCVGGVDIEYPEEVMVELIIDYATPERLELENGTLKLEPVLGPDIFEGAILYGSEVLKKVILKK